MFKEITNEALWMLTIIFWILLAFIIIYGSAWVYTHKTAKQNI